MGTALHGKEAEKLLVDWVSRYNIPVGIAQGLNYHHHDCQLPVIHRDIKSNNILLDAKLEASIADFRLVRMMVDKNETVSIVARSYGAILHLVDEKRHIYSFGAAFGESTDIVERIQMKIKSNRTLAEALDPSIAGHCKHVQEEMLLVLRITLLCTAKVPKDRPSMRNVITMLGEAKPRRKSVCHNGGHNLSKERQIFVNSPVVGKAEDWTGEAKDSYAFTFHIINSTFEST